MFEEEEQFRLFDGERINHPYGSGYAFSLMFKHPTYRAEPDLKMVKFWEICLNLGSKILVDIDIGFKEHIKHHYPLVI